MNGQEIATRFLEAFDRRDPAGLASLYAEDATMTHPFFPEGVRGRDAILANEKPLFDAFSEISTKMVSVTESGNKVALEWCVDATHTSGLPLPDGSVLPATGRRISQPGVDVFYLDADGLIAEGHRYQDGAGFMAQLGLG